MSPDTEAAFSRMADSIGRLAESTQQAIASQHRQNARLENALAEVAEQQGNLTREVRELGQKMGDMQALVRSNREILAEMQQGDKPDES